MNAIRRLVIICLFLGWPILFVLLTAGDSRANSTMFDFQELTSAQAVCGGTSTVNITSEAGISANGTLRISNSFDPSADPYHFNWTSGATGPATGLSDDMYTPPFNVSTILSSFQLRFYGNSSGSNLFARLYDFDGSACSSTLIGQTSAAALSSGCGSSCPVDVSLDISPYQINPGHRIRIELWVQKNGSGAQLQYGTTHLGFMQVTGVTTQTTTVGPGVDPADAVVQPGGAAAGLDAFTLQTDGGPDSIEGAMITLSPSASYSYIGSVAVTNDSGSLTYGAVTNPSSWVIWVPFSPFPGATTTSAQFRVMITPKAHSAMPPPPGGEYVVHGTVTGLSSMNMKAYNDTGSAAVTIDNQSAGTPSWGVVTTADSQITLNWTNPADTDFSGVVVLRNTSSITDVPVEGQTYGQGNTLGSSTVIYAGNLQTFNDIGVTNSTAYYYRIFAADTRGNYSAGSQAGPFMPVIPLTVGDGANPSDSAMAPGGPATMLDSFTLRTSLSAVTVTGVTVSLAPGAASALSALEITSDNGSTVYGSAANPASDTVTLTLSQNIIATSTQTQYKVRVTPKSHSGMPSPPGQSFSVTGTVTAIATIQDTDKTYGDNSSATVTIDNLSTGNPAWGMISVGDAVASQPIVLNWTNPADADFSQVLILRNTSPIADTPVEGTTYAIGNTIGSSSVRYIGAAQTWNDYGISNGTSYHYRIFAKDAGGNYSPGAAAGPYIPNVILTVGDGTDPADAALAPGGPPAMLDSFTMKMSSGSGNYVTGITVSLAAGTAGSLSLLELTSDDGATVYGSVVNPESDTVTIPVGINVYTSGVSGTAQCKVRITPKSHANMPSRPGSLYGVTGAVTGVTTSMSANRAYNDTSITTVILDNLSPGNPVWGVVTPAERQITLNWANPADPDFSKVIILRKGSAISDSPVEGAAYVQGDTLGSSSVIYAGNLQTFTDTGLSSETNYFYKTFALDGSGNYSTGAATGPHQPLVAYSTTALNSFATAQGTTGISVQMNYADDGNSNNVYSVDYKPIASGTWTNWITGAPHASSPYSASITGLVPDLYDIRMTFADPDGVVGTNPQITARVDLTGPMTRAGSATALPGILGIFVSTPFDNDDNINNTCLVDYKLSASGTWTNGALQDCRLSPVSITGLTNGNYDIRVTYQDPDGVLGEAVQTINSILPQSDKIIHNSRTANKKNYWSQFGGWGLPGTQYGEFTCATCHEPRAWNLAGIRGFISLMPLPGPDMHFGGPVVFQSKTAPDGFGDDSILRDFPPPVSKICEVCHTQTYGRIGPDPTPPGQVHRFNQTETSNHANANGTDCTWCHTHNTGFKAPW